MRKCDVIEAFEATVHVAKVAGVTREAVRQWPEVIPEPRASQIREAIRAKIVRLQEMVK